MSWNGTVKCSHCWERGHNKRTCPTLKKFIKENPESWRADEARRKKANASPRKCGWCGAPGHNTRTCSHKIDSQPKLDELAPLFETHVGHILSLAGLGRGALITKTDWDDTKWRGVVVSASLSQGKLWKPQSVVNHSEPRVVVLWSNGSKDSSWLPQSIFRENVSLTEVLGVAPVHDIRSWGYSSVKLLTPSHEDIAVDVSLTLESGQKVDALEKWNMALRESVKKCEAYRKGEITND